MADGLGSLDQVTRDIVKDEDIVDYAEEPGQTFGQTFWCCDWRRAVQAARSSVSIH